MSKDAERRLKYFISILNPAENASKLPEHGYKANVAGSGIKSSSVFNSSGHDDPKTYTGALIEGTVSDRFLRSVLRYAKALAWFRGKPQVDTEDIATVVIPASMHRFKASPHFEKLDILYKYDAWERSRQLWTMAMEKYATKHTDRPETVSEHQAVPAYFVDKDYADAQAHENYDDLRDTVDSITGSGAKLATIVKTMEHFASTHLEGSEGLEELLAMKLLFFEIYGQVLDGKIETAPKPIGVSATVAEKVKPTSTVQPAGTTSTNVDPAGMSYIALSGGASIAMGSTSDNDNPPHTVSLRPFQMAKYLVTQEQYEKIMGNNPSYFQLSNDDAKEKLKQAGITDTSQHPVEQVSYEEGYAYAQKLSLMDPAIPETIKSQFRTLSAPAYADYVIANPGKGLYRPATDSEREYATQGGATTKYFWGDDFTKVKEYGWTAVDSDAGGITHPVGKKKANAFGLFDVIGNVWTGTHDWYKDSFYESGKHYDNPIGPATGTSRGLRGGSWNYDNADFFRSAYRFYDDPSFRDCFVGLRLVRT
ncbi:MAG: SUMF1/EgtB/PvdO family nonheme iron enzyme [Candidatus Margulisiibacteriota bacterium]